VRDFHVLRVTWVTLALTAGVPLELVQKVAGHKTTDIVLKHYFQPRHEDFRLALEGAMPKLLTVGTSGGQSSVVSDRSPVAKGEGQGATGGKAASPPPPRSSGGPREEMRELLEQVKPKELRERLLKVWAKLWGATRDRG
jgi:hypothetical protein